MVVHGDGKYRKQTDAVFLGGDILVLHSRTILLFPPDDLWEPALEVLIIVISQCICC
jgi:hypothetical protein